MGNVETEKRTIATESRQEGLGIVARTPEQDFADSWESPIPYKMKKRIVGRTRGAARIRPAVVVKKGRVESSTADISGRILAPPEDFRRFRENSTLARLILRNLPTEAAKATISGALGAFSGRTLRVR